MSQNKLWFRIPEIFPISIMRYFVLLLETVKGEVL